MVHKVEGLVIVQKEGPDSSTAMNDAMPMVEHVDNSVGRRESLNRSKLAGVELASSDARI